MGMGVNSPQDQEQQQEQEQKPPTTYGRSPLDRLLWNCVAYGALVRAGRHLNEQQLQWVVDVVRREDGVPDEIAGRIVLDALEGQRIEFRGELIGATLAPERRYERCVRIVEAVRRGLT